MVSRDEISNLVEELSSAQMRGAAVFIFGNGGSAASASHWVNDLMRNKRYPIRAISLVDNAAVVSAVGNDHGFEYVFRYQLHHLLRPGDVAMAISASGNSPNLLVAISYAKRSGATTVALTGFDGGELRGAADISVHVPSERGAYGPVEDAHMILGHLVTQAMWDALDTRTDAT